MLSEHSRPRRCRRRPFPHVAAGALLSFAALSLILAGCTLGPDFHRPAAVVGGNYTDMPLPAKIGATGPAAGRQRLRPGNDLVGDWWILFRSDPLDRLVAEALRDSPSMAAASAALREAQKTYAANRASQLLPSVGSTFSGQRSRISGAEFGLPFGGIDYTLFNAQVNVSYNFDLFGGVRRQLEALQAQVDFEQDQLRAARLTLAGNVVTSVIRAVQLRDQIAAQRAVAAMQQDGLAIVARRFDIGAVSQADVLAQQTALAQTQAGIAGLEKQRAQMLHLLAVYLGKSPSEADLRDLDTVRLTLPQDLPVSVGSDLVRQRPDILASEALLHAASAQVGVATANLYPQLSLGANFGSVATTAGSMFTANSAIWGLNAGLAQPLFHGGALDARDAAIAAFDQAAAAYRQTVLAAFANVSDALRALQFDAEAAQAQSRAYEQARASQGLISAQYRDGGASYLNLLAAQQQVRQTSVALAQAQADRLADTAALFQAVGGGWWNAGGRHAAPLAKRGAPSVARGAANGAHAPAQKDPTR